LNQRDLLQYLGEDGGKKKSLEISKSWLENTIKMDLKNLNEYNQCI
jgi:hypothetical protein